ncbi:MAG: CCA tRNA nucleotidyltransferase [Epsilonproteobacteria bacterium]|nr:CCA tRNA nucleotidyltransferase [Campylobacterota bacterium]
MNKLILQDPHLSYIRDILSTYTNRAYLVGGAVRDIVMNQEVSDFDIEVYDISVETFEKLMVDIGAKGVGKSFFVYKYKHIDLSLPRTESKVGYGHKGFSVSLTQDEKLASLRRDFSMNSIMINIFNFEILDFYGGIADIHNKIIRLICANKFQEDSLRVLRAMQFSSRLGFRIEPHTIEVCGNMDLSDLSMDRIVGEFLKMFDARYLYYGYYYMIMLKIDQKIFHTRFCFWTLAKTFTSNPHKAYFLYHLYHHYRINIDFFPKAYKKLAFIKPKPHKITNRFLYALSLRYPLAMWSVLNNDCAKEWLIKHNIYHHKYKPHHIDMSNPKQSILQEIRSFVLQYINC